MKYFVVSDIHGYYDVLVNCLNNSGYNEKNSKHKLIIIGDMIDRGPQSKEVLEYAYRLYKENKAVVILGNHDNFLLEFFKGNFERVLFNFDRNGHKKTFDSLLNREFDREEDFKETRLDLIGKYSHLYDFLLELPLYFELGDYIFVHGAIDSNLEDWRIDTVRNFTWNYMHLMEPLPGKTIVVGHTQAVRVRTKEKNLDILYKESPDMFDILYGNGTIHIDGSVMTTKNINVLIIE